MYKDIFLKTISVFLGVCLLVRVYNEVYTIVFGEKFSDDIRLSIYYLAGLFFLILMALGAQNIVFRYKISREARYARAIKMLSGAFVDIHNLKHAEINDKKARLLATLSALTTTCHHVSRAFSFITKRECSSCIKVMTPDKEGVQFVTTVARDRDAYANGRKAPDSGGVKHYVNDNTDFKELITIRARNSGDSYLSNNIPFLKDYKNTSFISYNHPVQYKKGKIVNLFRYLWRTIKWPLPYKSTLIVPIEPLVGVDINSEISKLLELQTPENNNNNNLPVGFLCVDSKSAFAFRKRYDVDVLKGVAEGIYNEVNLLTE